MKTTKLANTVIYSLIVLVIVAVIWAISTVKYHTVKHVMTEHPTLCASDTVKIQPIITYTDTTYYQIIYEDTWGKVLILGNKEQDL